MSYDLEAGATYVELAADDVARTVHVGDLLAVDLDALGEPIGVEILTRPADITDEMLHALAAAFPTLKPLAEDRSWLLTRAH